MGMNATTIPAHFGDVRWANTGPGGELYGGFHLSPVHYTLDYLNNLPVDVVVVWRSGLKFRLPSQPNIQSNKFVARVGISLNQQVKSDVERVLSVVSENTSAELKAMRDAFSANIQGGANGQMKLTIDYAVDLERLKEMGGTVYFHELDCLISVLRPEQVPPHPYSEEGMKQQVVAGSLINNEMGFGYSVEIIDNANRFGDRFLNIAGKVYQITPKRDFTRRPGIYILSNRFIEGEALVADDVDVKYYSFDASVEEELGLYRSYDEALHRGDLNTARKAELAQLQHDISINRAALENVKHQHDIEMVEKNKQLEELKQRYEARAQELKEVQELLNFERDIHKAKMKDHYEERAHQRKDWTEVLKVIPTIVMGIASVIMAIKAFTGDSK